MTGGREVTGRGIGCGCGGRSIGTYSSSGISSSFCCCRSADRKSCREEGATVGPRRQHWLASLTSLSSGLPSRGSSKTTTLDGCDRRDGVKEDGLLTRGAEGPAWTYWFHQSFHHRTLRFRGSGPSKWVAALRLLLWTGLALLLLLATVASETRWLPWVRLCDLRTL